MKYERISLQMSEEIENATVEQLAKVDKALVAAAYAMRDHARRLLVTEGKGKGYRLDRLQEGVMLGRLRKSPAGETSITLHAMGKASDYNSFKTRFFAGGAYHRQTGKGRNRGTIEDLKTIEQSLDEKILDDYINNAIK